MSVIATQFSPIPLALLRDPTISPQAKALYAAIRSYADFGRQSGARPSQAAICRDLGFKSETTFVKWRAELGAAGWLGWTVRRSESGRATSTDYLCHDQRSPAQMGEVPRANGGRVPRANGDNREPIPRAHTESPRHTKATWLTPFVETYRATLGCDPDRKALTALSAVRGEPGILDRWRFYCERHRGQQIAYLSARRFVATHTQWIDPTDPLPGESVEAYAERLAQMRPEGGRHE